MKFAVNCWDSHSNARAGLIHTDRGEIETPIFMPVGTVGAVKGMHVKQLKEDVKAQIILETLIIFICDPVWRCLKRQGGYTNSTVGINPC